MGDFVGGSRQGQGIMFFTNGGYREGTWDEDRLVGQVHYARPDGTVETEIFAPDRAENDQRARNGEISLFEPISRLLESKRTVVLE